MIYLNLLIVFLLLIFIHELGHYTASRFFGAKVTDFSIGFGKSLFTFKDKNHTNWKFSLIPLGGYVKIKGLESIFQNVNQKNPPQHKLTPKSTKRQFQPVIRYWILLCRKSGSLRSGFERPSATKAKPVVSPVGWRATLPFFVRTDIEFRSTRSTAD